LVIEVAVPTPEGVLAAAGRDIFLQLEHIVETHAVLEQAGTEVKALRGLEVGRLVGQTGSARIVENCPD
jgi:hypothetical protein